MNPSFLNLPHQSQKLIQCRSVNLDGSESLRFVELEQFRLWSYMMLHKHKMTIKDSSLGLWIEEDSFEERREIYSRFPDITEVNKICLFLFDEINGFSHAIYRYALREETPMLEKILLSHLSPQAVANNNYQIITHQGYCITTCRELNKITLGLAETDIHKIGC